MAMSGDTTVAASDGFAATVTITAKVKRKVREALGAQGVNAKLVMIRMFVGSILLAIQDHLSEVGSLTIDEEYTG